MLLITNGLVYAAQQLAPEFMLTYFPLWPLASQNPQFKPWQLVTYGFLHDMYGLSHILFNMFGLWMFGRDLERLMGPQRFLIYYMTCVIGAGVVQLVVAGMQGGTWPTLGASGGVSAIIFSWIIFYPTQSIYIWGLLPLPGFLLGVLFLVYSYYEGKRLGGRINHDAHLFGALFGIVFTIVTVPAVIESFFDQLMRFDFF